VRVCVRCVRAVFVWVRVCCVCVVCVCICLYSLRRGASVLLVAVCIREALVYASTLTAKFA
jgi:hypothetical protein